MKAQDIVDKLSAVIPRYTDAFSQSIGVISIVPAGNIATVTTNGVHGMVNGQNAAIINANAPVQIDTVNSLRTGSQFVIETLQDHDLTLSESDKIAGGKSITISGANESEFNGTFSLIAVLNRQKVIVNVADSGPTTISGSPLIDNANGGIFNGIFEISNVTTTTFNYTLPISYPLPAIVDDAIVQITIHILSVLDINQYLSDIYTNQSTTEDQLVIQLGDVTRNKKQTEVTDAVDSSVGEYAYTPSFIQSFAIYIIQNVTDLIGGATARDKVESLYIPAIFKSVERANFDTGFEYSQYKSVCTEHGVFGYDTIVSKGKALYIHEVVFQQLATLDKIADTVEINPTVAMRDVSFTLATDLGTGELLGDVDLDQEPLS